MAKGSGDISVTLVSSQTAVPLSHLLALSTACCPERSQAPLRARSAGRLQHAYRLARLLWAGSRPKPWTCSETQDLCLNLGFEWGQLRSEATEQIKGMVF